MCSGLEKSINFFIAKTIKKKKHSMLFHPNINIDVEKKILVCN